MVYTQVQGEVSVGGVFLRLFIAQPTWVLRKPKEFLIALLEKFGQLTQSTNPDVRACTLTPTTHSALSYAQSVDLHHPRISCTNLGSQLCAANPGMAWLILHKLWPRSALVARTYIIIVLSPPLVLSSQASGLFASEGGCMSFLVCIRTKYTLRCVSKPRGHAFSLHETRIRIYTCNQERHAAPLALANSPLAYCYSVPLAFTASLQRPNKGMEKACVHARLLRGAKHADLAQHTRFVCTIPGSLRRVRIQGLHKKIRGWRESALCA